MGPSLLQPVRFALVLGLLVAGGLLLYKLVGVIEVLALALLIALILDPAVNLLVRLRFPRFLALLVVLASVVVGLGLLAWPAASRSTSRTSARAIRVSPGAEGRVWTSPPPSRRSYKGPGSSG